MIFPKYLPKNGTIGITAPSEGVKRKEESFELSLNSLKKKGFQVIETANVRNGGIVSSTAKERAEQLMELIKDDRVDAVMCATGGDFLMEMLSELDLAEIKKYPKWIQGYSDPTGILYTVTTNCDIATSYGPNGGAYDMTTLHKSLEDNLQILQGNYVEQRSFEKYQSGWGDGCDGYDLDSEVFWETPNGVVNESGRLIGGCLDVLVNLVGTRFDNTRAFVEKYAKDGFIWYFDVFSLRAEDITRGLWQLKEAGWFAHAKAYVFGRVRFPDSLLGISYEEGICRILKDAPLILNADVGHVKPYMTMINGAMCRVTSENGRGSIQMWEG